ncbi:MAG: hypothetical protein JWN02_2501 [Acidobacteria bacterium]|nr:hypothetical protein [Acidobacteriota bacterium]
MRKVLRILPLAVALGAISALAAPAPLERSSAARGADLSTRAASSAAASALVRFYAAAAVATHAMPVDLGLAPAPAPLLPASVGGGHEVRIPFATRPLLGAATPRAPAAL